MTKLFSLAGAALLLAAVPALADEGPRIVGGGDNLQIIYPDGPRGNVVGGGRTVIGWDPQGRIIATYLDPAPSAYGFASITGGGDNAVLAFTPVPGAASSALAGRSGGTTTFR